MQVNTPKSVAPPAAPHTPPPTATTIADALDQASKVVVGNDLDPTIRFAADDSSTAARMTTMFQRQVGEGWTGGDAAYSRRLPDGRTAWIFGDTFIGGVQRDGSRTNDPGHFIRNSVVIQDGTKLTTVTGGTHGAPADLATPSKGVDTWFWPGDAVAREGTLHLFMTRMRPGADVFWGWKKDGTELVELDTTSLQVRAVTPISDDPRISWGAATLDRGAHTYIFGAEDDALTKHAHLARAKADDLTGPWEFWNGRGWSTDAASSARLAGVDVSNQFSVIDDAKGGVRLITQHAFDHNVKEYRAASPEGPWSPPRDIARIPDQIRDRHVYNALAHPDLSEPGKLLLSYNVGGIDFMADHTSYKPRFLEIDESS